MDEGTLRRHLRLIFDSTAPRYVERIDPAFKPLAEGLVSFAALRPDEHALDLGTGSGLAAIAAARHAARVVGLDLSRRLLEQARANSASLGLGNVDFVQGDMHTLSFAAGTFDVVLAAFSFNHTDPSHSFSEAARVLVPGGRLVIQEWGANDAPSDIAYDAVVEYAVEDPPPPLAALREVISTPDAWDESIDGIEDLTRAIEAAGFRELALHQETPSIHFESIDAFLSFELAWASRHEELEAMPPEWRDLLFSELHDRLEPHLTDESKLIWQPEVIRVRAVKAAR